jgi:predicted NBD/HSP70 family sugar kinase
MHSYFASEEQIASNKTPRRINRNLLFHLIRTRQPVSRADLSRLSGLQRSTVSLIVEELIADRWIVEGPIGRLPRGRRPTFLQLNDQRAVIALDIHPAQTSVGISDMGGKIIAQNIIVLPRDPMKAIATIVTGIRKVISDHGDKSFVGVGICLPGRTNLHLQKAIFAPNLKWPITGIKSRIERSTGLRVTMDNVANACALSEVWFGDNNGIYDLVVVNVSEGLGTGIFANGQLLRGDNGMAGEFGHVQLESPGVPCSCGSRGCWETLASNRAALRYYRELAPSGRGRTFDLLLRLAQKGDRAAFKALSRASVELGRGMRMIASALAPREIIVVGDITSAWLTFGPIVEAEMRKNSALSTPSLRPSSNGDTARLRSAVALVLNEGLLKQQPGHVARQRSKKG